jgi:hypothetical protein
MSHSIFSLSLYRKRRAVFVLIKRLPSYFSIRTSVSATSGNGTYRALFLSILMRARVFVFSFFPMAIRSHPTQRIYSDRVEFGSDWWEYFFTRIGSEWDEGSATLTIPVAVLLDIVCTLELRSCQHKRSPTRSYEETIRAPDPIRTDREDARECPSLVCQDCIHCIT